MRQHLTLNTGHDILAQFVRIVYVTIILLSNIFYIPHVKMTMYDDRYFRFVSSFLIVEQLKMILGFN